MPFLRSGGDAAMYNGSTGHVEKPTPEQAVVQRSDVEATPQEQCPKIDQEGCAEPDKSCTDDVSCFVNRELPRL